jgi:hypothetical protein
MITLSLHVFTVQNDVEAQMEAGRRISFTGVTIIRENLRSSSGDESTPDDPNATGQNPSIWILLPRRMEAIRHRKNILVRGEQFRNPTTKHIANGPEAGGGNGRYSRPFPPIVPNLERGSLQSPQGRTYGLSGLL